MYVSMDLVVGPNGSLHNINQYRFPSVVEIRQLFQSKYDRARDMVTLYYSSCLRTEDATYTWSVLKIYARKLEKWLLYYRARPTA